MSSTLELLELLVASNASINDYLRQITDKLGNSSISSVQVATSARGYDVQVKCYTGSDVQPAGDAAVSEYLRVRAAIEDQLMGNGRREEFAR